MSKEGRSSVMFLSQVEHGRLGLITLGQCSTFSCLAIFIKYTEVLAMVTALSVRY